MMKNIGIHQTKPPVLNIPSNLFLIRSSAAESWLLHSYKNKNMLNHSLIMKISHHVLITHHGLIMKISHINRDQTFLLVNVVAVFINFLYSLGNDRLRT